MIDLEKSTQINNGFCETSADGACLAFDAKYGIMFCAYMPGHQGSYGESRGRISLSYFPASQPTNIKFVTVSEGNTEYLPNILGLGDGRVRVFYEKNSRDEGDHPFCYKDFDFLTEELSEERYVRIIMPDGSTVPYGLSAVFDYLEKNGCHNHKYIATEQMGLSTPFRHDDGYVYCAATTESSEPVLYRSKDNMATIEFFAIFPHNCQYEFDYRFLDGDIYAIYRTSMDENSINTAKSSDNGKTWTVGTPYMGSIQCRPRMLLYNGHILTVYNYFNADTGNRPSIMQGRTSVRIIYGEELDGDKNKILLDLHSKYGIVNVCITEILGDLYLAYSTSVLALEYQNGNPAVRGKDAIRYIKLGDLLAE